MSSVCALRKLHALLKGILVPALVSLVSVTAADGLNAASDRPVSNQQKGVVLYVSKLGDNSDGSS